MGVESLSNTTTSFTASEASAQRRRKLPKVAPVARTLQLRRLGEGADPGAEGADPGADTAVEERRSVADVVGSFTRMFEAIQFVSVGVVLRPWYVVEHAYWLLLVLTFLITVKTFTGGVVMHVLDGCPRSMALVIGGCVANVSEFSFAIVNRAYLLGIVGKERFRPMLCLCVLSWLLAPVLNYRVVPWVLRGGRGRGRRR